MNALLQFTPSETNAKLHFGISQEEFRERYFEKKYLLVRSAFSPHEIAWSDIDELLLRIDPLPPYFKLFHDGEVSAQEFVDEPLVPHAARRINKARFYDYLRRGATVVMNRLEQSSLQARRLCQQVGRFAGHPTMSNGYLSFGGKGTFGKHWDTHDVFVIQLLGKKRWQVFKPTWPLPLSHQKSEGIDQSAQSTLGAPELDCELHPGDLLYLPRGWWHQAIPADEGSFHLSVGAYAPTAMEFVQWICHERLSHLPSARVGLTGGEQQMNADEIAQEIAKALRDPKELENFHRSLNKAEQVTAEFDLRSIAESGSALPDDATMHLNSSYPIAFDGAQLTINGQELRLESLRRVLVLNLDKAPSMSLAQLYACVPSVPQSAVRAAILDLAQHDILTIHRP
jgi:ribosomal protein L16 Arg81 hydroxylase